MPTQETEIAGETTDAGRGRVFPCENCGADLVFEIGQQSLKCPYCGHEKKIELAADAEIHEQDFPAMLDKLKAQKSAAATEPETDPDGNNEVRCQSCGGTVLFVGTLTSTECPYCGSPIQREHVHSATNRIPVDGVLPFLVPKEQAHTLLSEWVTSRWFAPNEYLKRGIEGKFNGVYLPYWTFDTLTLNAFSGSRGDTYTIVVGSGNNQRIETHIRWTAASGRFQPRSRVGLTIGETILWRQIMVRKIARWQ